MSNKITKLKSIRIEKFRGLKGVEIPIADRITVICGKNGTSKSTILGIIAQAFSFKTDYTTTPITKLSTAYRTLSGKSFESVFSEHFRLSEKFDTPGEMDVKIHAYDGAEDMDLTLSLGLYKYGDRQKPRPIIRGNTKTNAASSSRNVTHPVIYLSLARLTPIASRTHYAEHDIEYLKQHASDFKRLNNAILSKPSSTTVTSTKGTIDSTVVHGADYDKDSVSAGEDNTGQILQALFSFRRLKEQYSNYHGGILLIDEADAGLFPSAQVEFINLLAKEAKQLNLQVIMTSHSPTLLEQVLKLSSHEAEVYKTVYLTDTHGDIKAMQDWSWPQIYADLHIETKVASTGLSLPKVNLYFEDKEAIDFFTALTTTAKIKKTTKCQTGITLGCENYKQLMSKKIPEFSRNSIVVFDADVTGLKAFKNAVVLPSGLPPDQLLFEFLYNLPKSDSYWVNPIGFTKPVFLKIARGLCGKLELPGDDVPIDLAAVMKKKKKEKPDPTAQIRSDFKSFYKAEEIQSLLTVKGANPFKIWMSNNSTSVEEFKAAMLKAIKHVLVTGYGYESAQVTGYFD